MEKLTFCQEAWDQYMQPGGNISFDPAANPWNSVSPNNNMFTQTSSPDSPNDTSFDMNSNIYSQNIGSVMGGPMDFNKSEQGPTLSAGTPGNNNDQSAGEVFMGVQSPQPGGIPSWKWTVMNDKK